MTFRGQVAVVTGAASGIGLAIARELAAHGGSVAVADIAGDGGRAVGVAANVTSRSAVEALFGKVEAELGPVDILVNNAGISINRGVRRVSDADWQRTIAVNQT